MANGDEWDLGFVASQMMFLRRVWLSRICGEMLCMKFMCLGLAMPQRASIFC
jgi:hypothetical protein